MRKKTFFTGHTGPNGHLHHALNTIKQNKTKPIVALQTDSSTLLSSLLKYLEKMLQQQY